MMPHIRPAAAAVALAAAIAIGFGAPAPAAEPTSPPFSDAGYWAFADRLMGALEPEWSPSRGAYVSAGGAASARVNSALLFTHSIAALSGHRDRRARTRAPPSWSTG